MTVREKLAAGQKAAGTMLRLLRNPAGVVLAADAGLDFVMFDCEHSCYSMETLHDMFVTCRLAGMEGFVRVPEGTKDWISRVLDQGALGVMVPMIETAEQAQNLVHYAKYQPIGGRGYSSMVAHTLYRPGEHTKVMEDLNRRTTVIAQIETLPAVENCEAIAAVEGIDALLIGPNDLSLSLGIPGQLTHPDELAAIARVAAACKQAGKAFGMHAGGKLLEMFRDDVTLAMTGTDTDILAAGFRQLKETCGKL